jgi:glucan-binding YG repeat protein
MTAYECVIACIQQSVLPEDAVVPQELKTTEITVKTKDEEYTVKQQGYTSPIVWEKIDKSTLEAVKPSSPVYSDSQFLLKVMKVVELRSGS